MQAKEEVKILEKGKIMEKLLKEDKGLESAKMGEVIKGKVLEIGNNILYLDLGKLGGGIVLGRELQDGLGTMDELKVGDEVEATVIDEENKEGYIELSLREAGYDKAWEELERKMKEGEIVNTRILEANKGGLIVKVNGVVGFLPVSQLTTKHYPRVENGDKNRILSILEGYVGEDFKVRIIAAEKDNEKLIVSEKAVEAEEMQKRIKKLKVGEVVEGVVSGVVDFGAFVKFNDDLEGLVHISELAWQRIEDPRDIIEVGSTVQCKIIGLDKERISLSIKALKEDPWIKKAEKYKVGSKVEGEVTKVNTFGAFVQLDKDIHGLAHVSELPEGSTPVDFFEAGKTYSLIVVSIKPKEHRLGLCLETLWKEKQKKEKAKKDIKKDKEKKKEEKTEKPEKEKAKKEEKK
jgi:small subunit ribosomal protein S1